MRALTGLGLKEAKEKVEGAPASVAKAEAEEIRDKLQELEPPLRSSERKRATDRYADGNKSRKEEEKVFFLC